MSGGFSLVEFIWPSCAEALMGLVADFPELVLLEICLGGSYAPPVPFTVGDDGGEIFELTGPWLRGVGHIIIVNGVYCYSGNQGEGYRPVADGRTLRGIIPPDLPVGGPYDIAVFWTDGNDELESILHEDVVTVLRRHRRSRTIDFARLWTPGVFAKRNRSSSAPGLQRTLEAGLILEAGATVPASVQILRSAIAAAGQLFNEAAGLVVTRLREDLPPAQLGTVIDAGAYTAEVETSYGFTPGEVVIEGEVIPFAGVTADSLTGLTRDDIVAESYRRGAPVVQWNRDTSDLERARNALLVDHAEGGFLSSIGRNYGVPRYLEADDALYRRMIRVLAYQAGRGTRHAIGEFLDLILERCELRGTDGELQSPNVLVSASAPFTEAMIGMDVEIGGLKYRINGFTDATTVSFALTPSLFWATPAFEASTDVPWRLVPWIIEEDPWDPATARVVMYCPQPTDPTGMAYLQGGELVTVADVNEVETEYEIRQVLGVWLAGDRLREGANYATTNNFAGTTITLDVALPGLVSVVVDYGSVANPTAPVAGHPGGADGAATAQILQDITIRNPGDAAEAAGYFNRSAPLVRYPLYVGDRTGTIAALLEELTVAGVRPRLEVRLW